LLGEGVLGKRYDFLNAHIYGALFFSGGGHLFSSVMFLERGEFFRGGRGPSFWGSGGSRIFVGGLDF